MNNKFNLFQEFSDFSEMFNFSSDFPQKISSANETPSLSNSLSDIKYEDFNSDIPPKKNLFKTKKIKTSFVIFKFPLHSHKKIETKNNFSNGRWTRQERIKFCEAIYHYGIDWKKLNEYITTSIKLIEEKMKDMEEISKPLIKGVFQLNYVLLKIYEKLINGIKDINDIEEYLNKLSENNLFGKNNTDHFCQYIISYLLAKVICIIIPEFNKDANSLHKKNYFLLNQIISEILSVDINDNNEENKMMNLIMIIKLLYVSNINSELKQKIFIEIISHQNLTSIESFWEKYNKENISLINVLNKEYINGIYYLNNNKLLEAFKCFLAGKKYEYALDIYLKYFFSLIKEKQINQINFEEILDNLKEIYEKSPSLINDFYLDFIRFISYIVKKEETNQEEIIDLLKKFMYEYYGKGKIIYLDEKSHRFIIKALCDILIEKNRENKDLILCGDLRINEMKNVLVDDKCDLMDNILNDLIEHKNNQFSMPEY